MGTPTSGSSDARDLDRPALTSIHLLTTQERLSSTLGSRASRFVVDEGSPVQYHLTWRISRLGMSP